MPENKVMLENLGIKCDGDCDYTTSVASAEEYQSYLNKPCPKCGENLLTEGDYEAFMGILKAMEVANEIEIDETQFHPEIQALLAQLQDPNKQALVRVEFVDGIPVMSSPDAEVQMIIDKIWELSLKEEG